MGRRGDGPRGRWTRTVHEDSSKGKAIGSRKGYGSSTKGPGTVGRVSSFHGKPVKRQTPARTEDQVMGHREQVQSTL